MTLDKPVKAYLMSAIKTVIEGISQIAQVKYGEDIPTDQDTASYPFASFYDDPEKKVRRNRIGIKSFDLGIVTFVKKGVSTIDEQMDLIDAELEIALDRDKNADLKKYSMSIEPESSSKMTSDDQETGILHSTFKVEYGHTWKNAYELPGN
jgi:hypothetical protein